jgi:hypothetical protein
MAGNIIKKRKTAENALPMKGRMRVRPVATIAQGSAGR